MATRKSEPQSVYAMLGYADPESMRVKARLASQMSEAIIHHGLSQSDAARLIGMPQPKLSKLLRGQFRGVSETKMMECLNALGCDIEIVVRPAPKGRQGQVEVVTQDKPKRVAASRRMDAIA